MSKVFSSSHTVVFCPKSTTGNSDESSLLKEIKAILVSLRVSKFNNIQSPKPSFPKWTVELSNNSDLIKCTKSGSFEILELGLLAAAENNRLNQNGNNILFLDLVPKSYNKDDIIDALENKAGDEIPLKKEDILFVNANNAYFHKVRICGNMSPTLLAKLTHGNFLYVGSCGVNIQSKNKKLVFKESDPRTLKISGLGRSLYASDLSSLISDDTCIEAITFAHDKDTGNSRGIAFVRFTSVQKAEAYKNESIKLFHDNKIIKLTLKSLTDDKVLPKQVSGPNKVILKAPKTRRIPPIIGPAVQNSSVSAAVVANPPIGTETSEMIAHNDLSSWANVVASTSLPTKPAQKQSSTKFTPSFPNNTKSNNEVYKKIVDKTFSDFKNESASFNLLRSRLTKSDSKVAALEKLVQSQGQKIKELEEQVLMLSNKVLKVQTHDDVIELPTNPNSPHAVFFDAIEGEAEDGEIIEVPEISSRKKLVIKSLTEATPATVIINEIGSNQVSGQIGVVEIIPISVDPPTIALNVTAEVKPVAVKKSEMPPNHVSGQLEVVEVGPSFSNSPNSFDIDPINLNPFVESSTISQSNSIASSKIPRLKATKATLAKQGLTDGFTPRRSSRVAERNGHGLVSNV